MVYEIFTYGGGDYLVEVLNATIRIMGANSFTTAMRISILFGLISVFFDIAINGNFTKGVKYYISFLLIYNALFVPKIDVIIIDPTNQIQGDRKVDNVPFGLGFMAHTISSLGNWMTDIFGMNFALPDDLQYNKNGMLFGSKIIKDTFNARMPNERTSNNFNNFIRQCIIPAVNLRRITVEQILKTSSIQEFLNTGKNGVLAYDFIDANGNRIINLCNNTTEISKEINIEVNKLIKQQENNFNKNNNANITSISQYILGIQSNVTKTFEQSLIANAVSDTTQEYLAITGANAGAINYAITKDDIQRKQNGVLQWIQAGKFLPLLKIIIEAMFYSLFPIVILLALLPNGLKIFKNYFLILIALQIWSPLYAILNLIMTLEQKYRLANVIAQGGGVVSLYSKQAIIDTVQGIQMQAGLLAFMIPPLSFKIIQGMQNLGENMASGIASSGSFATSNLVSEVASGNLSYGNGNFKNIAFDNMNYNNTSVNQFKAMRNNFISTEDQINSSRIALSQAESANKTLVNSYNKSLQDLQSFQALDESGNNKIHSFSDSGAVKLNVGIGGKYGIIKGSIDYEKAMSWIDSSNISKEDKKTLTNMIQKHSSIQNSYNQSVSDIDSKQKALDYNLQTSVHSGMDWNKEVYNYLKKQGYSDDWIDGHQREVQNIGNEFIKNQIFNSNKPNMLNNVNVSLDINRGNYDNQNNMIDAQYNYKKNYLDKNNQLHQMKNTEFSSMDFNIKRNNN